MIVSFKYHLYSGFVAVVVTVTGKVSPGSIVLNSKTSILLVNRLFWRSIDAFVEQLPKLILTENVPDSSVMRVWFVAPDISVPSLNHW